MTDPEKAKRLEAEQNISTTNLDNTQFFENNSRKQGTGLFGFPPQCFILLVVEICERFCFYGIRSILAVYLTDELGCTQTDGTSIYHMYIVLCYTTPILGGMISDQYLGKFKTISYLSIVYIIGNAVISYGSYIIDDTLKAFRVSMLGLMLISLGTGGIKPCVSSICGDQFRADDTETLDLFFDIFYLCINVGSMISSFLTPKLRAMSATIAVDKVSITPFDNLMNETVNTAADIGFSDAVLYIDRSGQLESASSDAPFVEASDLISVPTGAANLTHKTLENTGFLSMFCENLTEDSNSRCYSVAFGLPSLLMVVALLLFWLGSKYYVKNPPNGSVVADFSVSANKRILSKVIPTQKSKLRWSSQNKEEKTDTKRIFSMLAWILPIAGFWSIFDLAGTRFTYICKQIDSTIYSPFLRFCLFCKDTNWIKEDQVEAVNPLLLFMLVPVFNKFVFPTIEKLIRRKYTRLHKMLTGMFMLVLVNLFIYTVQLQVDSRFTYIFPEDNDDSPMNHTSLVYQMNYYKNGQYNEIFSNQRITEAVHSKEVHWNFKNYDSPKYGNAAVMPSNIFKNNGVTSKRVWAKNDKQYFSNAINQLFENEENWTQTLVDNTTPFIDFSIYHENVISESEENGHKINFIDHNYLVRKDRKIEKFMSENDQKSVLSKVYLKNARFNKFIMFENNQLHRIFQDENREKNGQNRVDVYSLNENFIEEFTKNSEYPNVLSGPNNGYNFICRNDVLANDILEATDSFLVNLPGGDDSIKNSTLALPNWSNMWRTPFYKKQVIPEPENNTGSKLHLWSFVIPQKSKCHFTNQYSADISYLEDLGDVESFEDPKSGFSSNNENEKFICVGDNQIIGSDEKCLNNPEEITLGVRAIYSIIDYSDGSDNKKAKFNKIVGTSTAILNSDFNDLTIPLLTIIILYVILTSVEILISISGLAYSYEQAPDRLKAFISSLWLVPVALGNIIVVCLNHIEAFQVSVLDYFKFNVGFSIFVFILYVYVTMNYETKQEYFDRKLEEEREQERLEEYEMLKMKNLN